MLSAQQLASCTGARLDVALRFVEPIQAAMDNYAIDTPQRRAMFLANVGHESAGLSRLTESLDYAVEALLRFGRHRISEEDARRYGRIQGVRPAHQQAIANCIYGGAWGRANLGNVAPDDGWRFRGRGLLHHTGRANAARARDRLRATFPTLNVPDFEAEPELLVQPLYAALAAGDFWRDNDLNALAGRGDFDGVCDRINFGRKTAAIGDSNGWHDRLRLYAAARKALGAAA